MFACLLEVSVDGTESIEADRLSGLPESPILSLTILSLSQRTPPDPFKPPLVIVGAGFTGLFTALHLRHQNHIHSIALIDPQERFSFKPLLYELLSGELAEDSICPTYESLLEGSDISFVQDRVTDIDLSGKTVVTQSGASYGYQHLVLAVGSVQGYRHTDGAEDHAFPFRSWDEGKGLERHLRDCLKSARAAADPAEKQALLTSAIVGGGPSGVEMAATLADLLPYWYEKLGGDTRELRILLLNHGKDILSGDSNAHLRHAALRRSAIPSHPDRAAGPGLGDIGAERSTHLPACRRHRTINPPHPHHHLDRRDRAAPSDSPAESPDPRRPSRSSWATPGQ